MIMTGFLAICKRILKYFLTFNSENKEPRQVGVDIRGRRNFKVIP